MVLTPLPMTSEGACVTGCVGSDQAGGKVRQQAPVQLAAAASDLTALIAVGGSGLAPDSTGTHLCNLLLPAARSFLFVWLRHGALGMPAGSHTSVAPCD